MSELKMMIPVNNTLEGVPTKVDMYLKVSEEERVQLGTIDLNLDKEWHVLGEPPIRLYWLMIDAERGYMERIVLPTGEEILFDHEAGKTDFEPLKGYVDCRCEYYVDGVYHWTKKLLKVGPNEDGVSSLFFGISNRDEHFRPVIETE